MEINICIFLIASGAAIMDLLYSRIFNIWLYGWIAAGLLRAALNGGVYEFTEAVIGMAIPFIILFVFFILGMMGAGDIKLLMVLGSWMKAERILNVMLLTFLIAGIYAFIALIIKRELLKRVMVFIRYIKEMFTSGIRSDYLKQTDGCFKIRLGIFVFIAVFLI